MPRRQDQACQTKMSGMRWKCEDPGLPRRQHRGKALDMTLALLVDTGLLQRYDQAGRAVFSIAPGKQLAAAYYRNTIIHYFLNSALAEMALARVADKDREENAAQGA